MVEDAFETVSGMLKSNYVAQTALIIYGQEGGSRLENAPLYQITENPVIGGEICAGKPLTKESLVKLCSLFFPALKQKPRYFPSNLISLTPFEMVWWMPAARAKQIRFSSATNMPSGSAPIPAMLFAVEGMSKALSFHAWALGENARPEPHTMIFHAPFFNIDAMGKVCLGNASHPDQITPDDIPVWESLFLETDFTLESPPELKGVSGEDLWKSLIGKRKRVFPTDCLVEYGTAGKLLSTLDGGE